MTEENGKVKFPDIGPPQLGQGSNDINIPDEERFFNEQGYLNTIHNISKKLDDLLDKQKKLYNQLEIGNQEFASKNTELAEIQRRANCKITELGTIQQKNIEIINELDKIGESIKSLRRDLEELPFQWGSLQMKQYAENLLEKYKIAQNKEKETNNDNNFEVNNP